MILPISGTYTALITPFKENEEIDWNSLENLVQENINEGISGLVPCGTTGECSTLSHQEHNEVIKNTIKFSNGKVPIIAGTGSNSTREAISLTKDAEKAGANALLLVNPYYNKPTQEGLFRHFTKIAENTKLPCILYNIPGRTSVNLETTTLLRIIEKSPNVIGIKEASGNLNQVKEIINKVPKYFSVLSGDDNLALDIIKLGGNGVISVASNIVPRAMSFLIKHALVENYFQAEMLNKSLQPLFKAEFIETNPIPMKYMLSLKGKCKEVYRLPLCEMSEEHKKEISKIKYQY